MCMSFINWVELQIRKEKCSYRYQEVVPIYALGAVLNGHKGNNDVPHSPQSGGVAKRINRILMYTLRAIMKQTKPTKGFWGRELLHATYLYKLQGYNANNTSKQFQEGS